MRRIGLVLSELVKKTCFEAEKEAINYIEFDDITPNHYQAEYDNFKTIVHTETVESVMKSNKNSPKE